MNQYKEFIDKLQQGSIYLFTVLIGDQRGRKIAVQEKELLSGNWKNIWDKDSVSFWYQVIDELQKDCCPYQYSINGLTVFVERVVPEPELFLCGAGHISLEIARLADYLEYKYTVLDEREEFSNLRRFPRAKECICQPFQEALEQWDFSSNGYYIIVTRGHKDDLLCLQQILQHPFTYVGMIGSRKKVAKVMEILKEQGYDDALLHQVHAPIGLPIGGQSPKEIAVSIAAELIQIKNKELPAAYLEREMKAYLLNSEGYVLAKIIAKRGSAPRGIGSWMLVGEHGVQCGSVGGGKIEYEAIVRAKELLKQGGFAIETYRLDTNSAASLGMWCGGEVDILFEVV